MTLLDYGMQELGLSTVPNMLKDLAWELKINGYDYDKTRLIENAADELEEFRNGDFEYTYDELLNIVWDKLDTDELKKLSKDIKHDLILDSEATEEPTVEEAMNKMQEWFSMDLKELKAELKFESLKVSGTKIELIERLKENYLLKIV